MSYYHLEWKQGSKFNIFITRWNSQIRISMIFKQTKKIIPHVWERPKYILNIFMMKWNDFSTNYNMYILFHCMNFFHPIDTIKTEFVIVRSSTNFLFAATWFFNSIGRRTRVGTKLKDHWWINVLKKIGAHFCCPLENIPSIYTNSESIYLQHHYIQGETSFLAEVNS